MVSVIVHGVTNFDEARLINTQVSKMEPRPAFYCLSACGLYGWAFADIGKLTYNYNEPGIAGKTCEKTINSIDFTNYL